jgi:hypothetical protein
MSSIYRNVIKNYINFRGWKTNRKIVVIESDDWGSVRMESEAALKKLNDIYSGRSISEFAKLDGLERTEDLELLFEVLLKYKDYRGNHPVITALALTSNPDFQNIKTSNFEYHSELITETYIKYNEKNLFELWKKEGIVNNLLFPQFHGKEHLHPDRYMARIADVNDVEYHAFLNNSIVGRGKGTSRKHNFMAAFEYHNEQDKINIEKRTAEGLKEFENLFGFKSKSFCPSQSVYGDHLYDVLKNNGVLAIQAGQQFRPEKLSLKKVNHYWGDQTSNGLIFTRRNCTFETYKGNQIDHIGDCLNEIEIAFKWGKPAVINSHRINFSSRISTIIRDKTLVDLDILFKSILKKWPDAEFLNSAELADFIYTDTMIHEANKK